MQSQFNLQVLMKEMRYAKELHNRGMLIVFEGCNYVGKSTLINKLIMQYPSEKFKIYKFPNRNTVSGHMINKFLKKQIDFTFKSDQIELFATNRKEQKRNILQDLNNGFNVICDRYNISGIVYPLYEQFKGVDLCYTKRELKKHMLSDNHDLYDQYRLVKTSKQLIIDNYINYILHYDIGMPNADITFLIDSDFYRNENEKYHKLDKQKLLDYFKYILDFTNNEYCFIDNQPYNIDRNIQKIYNVIKNKQTEQQEITYINIKN